MYDISVIMATCNAEDTVNRAVSSLLHKPFMNKIEVIIVDDCSTDTTPQIIQEFAEQYENIKVILLDKNTGSPSEPRNIGMRAATGKYLTFLDDDDLSNISGLNQIYNYAEKGDYDFVKGYLKVVENEKIRIVDRLYDIENLENKKLMDLFLEKQSTRIDFLLRNNFQKEHNIEFDKELKLGEDTVFYTEIFKCNPQVGYCDTFIQFHCKNINIENLSSTQKYQDKELLNHLRVWELAEKNMQEVGSSYLALRLPIAIRNTLMSIVSFSKGQISEPVFEKFSLFLNKNRTFLKKIYLNSRYQDLYDAILNDDYIAFKQLSKKRILVTGYDLKFILPVIPYLEQHYTVLVDEWTGHDRHDEKQSKELLNQADIIWCEWLLGNAVWYSQHKQKHQKLVIRAHRFEITRDFGYKVNYDNVNRVLAVGYFYLEEFQRKFNIPRSKMQLLSNYVEAKKYTGEKFENCEYNLGIIGAVPKLKGFLRSLHILKQLSEKDSRFKLIVVGKRPEEFSWVLNNSIEKNYYLECDKYIRENELEKSIIYTGHLLKEKIFQNISYVLSVSDLESFHLAVAEAYCDNTMGVIMQWDGAEYIYPLDIVFSSEEEIVEFVWKMVNDKEKHNSLMEKMRDYIIDNYDIEVFCEKIINILEAL